MSQVRYGQMAESAKLDEVIRIIWRTWVMGGGVISSTHYFKSPGAITSKSYKSVKQPQKHFFMSDKPLRQLDPECTDPPDRKGLYKRQGDALIILRP